MVKYGALSNLIGQTCYNHAIHLAVVDVFYKNKTSVDGNQNDVAFVQEHSESSDNSSYDEEVVEVDDHFENRGGEFFDNFLSDVDEDAEELAMDPSIRDILVETLKTIKNFECSCLRNSMLQKKIEEQQGKKLQMILDVKTQNP